MNIQEIKELVNKMQNIKMINTEKLLSDDSEAIKELCKKIFGETKPYYNKHKKRKKRKKKK